MQYTNTLHSHTQQITLFTEKIYSKLLLYIFPEKWTGMMLWIYPSI